MKTSLELRAREPGRYVASFPADIAGTYIIGVDSVDSAGKRSHVSTGIEIPYSKEYRDWSSNRDLLENIASMTDGKITNLEGASGVDFFRHDRPPAFRLREMWPLILLASMLFFLTDVAIRRIAIEWSEINKRFRWVLAWLRRRPAVTVNSPVMDRLRSRKESIHQTLERSTSFMASVDATPRSTPVDLQENETSSSDASFSTQTSLETLIPSPPPEAEESPTSRLLRAKRRVWEEREDEESP